MSNLVRDKKGGDGVIMVADCRGKKWILKTPRF
jgi:hypothetical protein